MPVNITQDNPKIKSFLETHPVGVLATASKSGLPHAATIYFSVEPDASIYFITKQRTAKHQNIQENPNVALVVFDAPSQTSVQVFGTAQVMDDYDALGLIYEKILTISESTTNNHKPPITKFEAGDSVLYRISPTTIRMAEFVKAEYPPVDQIFETVTTPSPSLESSKT